MAGVDCSEISRAAKEDHVSIAWDAMWGQGKIETSCLGRFGKAWMVVTGVLCNHQ
jgi:hypothetical protein